MILDNSAQRKMRIVEVKNSYETLRDFFGGPFAIGHKIRPSIHEERNGVMSYDVYIDDEGLLKDPEFFFQVITRGDEVSKPLAGKAIIVATNFEGESVSVNPNEIILNLQVQASFVTKEQKDAWNRIVQWHRDSYGDDYGIEEAV